MIINTEIVDAYLNGKILVNSHLYSFIGRPIEAYFKSLKKIKQKSFLR